MKGMTMANEGTAQIKVEDIEIPEDLKFPEFANAFRILAEPGGDCIVEFLVYVAQDKCAKVVARVRIRNEFLVNIRDVINNVLPRQHQQPIVHASGQLVSPDGEGIAIFQPGGIKDASEGEN
jgi:hypothetical protein